APIWRSGLAPHRADRRLRAAMLTFAEDESERTLAAFWDAYVEGGRRGVRHALANPGAAWQAFRAMRALPRIDAAPTDSPGGRAVRRVLATRVTYGVPARLLGTAVLEIPPEPDSYLAGR